MQDTEIRDLFVDFCATPEARRLKRWQLEEIGRLSWDERVPTLETFKMIADAFECCDEDKKLAS